MENTQFEHVLIVDRNGDQTRFILNNAVFSIGRHSSNSLVLKSKVISRFHATILPFYDNKENNLSFWIIDGNEQGIVSTNGFTVNDQPCLTHQLKTGDQIVLPENTKIIYEVKQRVEEPDEDEDLPTGFIEKPEKLAIKDNQFKIKTDFHQFLSSSRLDTRIYIQNMAMLYMLLEKELDIVRSKNQALSLVFILYNINKIKEKYPTTHQNILRLYRLALNQKVESTSDFILSFNQFEIIVLHNTDHKKVGLLIGDLNQEIQLTTIKLNLPGTESIVLGAYSQIPENERNVKMLIERVGQVLQGKANQTSNVDGNFFVDLNLLGLE